MEKEEVPLPDEEYEAKHSKNGELQILYLAVSATTPTMISSIPVLNSWKIW